MKPKTDLVYLKHILEAVEKIEDYTKNLTYSEFARKPLVQDGVVRQFMIIGEAVKNISSQTRKKHENIAWSDIAKMRDKLIHHYFGVDLEVVWKAVKKDVLELKKQLLPLTKTPNTAEPEASRRF